MKVCIYSVFRDNGSEYRVKDYIKKFFDRVENLDYTKDDIRVVVAEGDSVDNTYELLKQYESDTVTVLKNDTGHDHNMYEKYRFQSHPEERLAILARMYNACIDEMVEQNWADVCWLIESDIPYNPPTLKMLLDEPPSDFGVVAPMVWINGKNSGIIAYDLWGYRAFPGTLPLVETKISPDGEEVQHFPPNNVAWYTSNLVMKHGSMIELAAACAGFITKMSYMTAGCRMTSDDESAGMQKQIRDMGGKVYVNMDVHLFHPLEPWHTI